MIGKLLWVTALVSALMGQTVSTGQYDNARTGANTAEVYLTQANAANIKLLGTFTVDAPILAQPLVIAGVNISGAGRVLVTATLNNSIYAFNADKPGTAFLWKTNIGTPVATTDADLYNNSIGCVATPVVDVPNSIVYALCDDSTNHWRLYSLNLSDGTTHHAPVTIAGTANSHTFDGTIELGRPALLFANSNIYVAFGSFFDLNSYFGWVMAYNSSLTQVGLWVSESSGGSQGAVWMSGGGIASDGSGNQFLVTGNGTCGAASANFGESVVRLNSTAVEQDYMTPTDCSSLNGTDSDLGASRTVLVGAFVITIGKDGRLWVLNTAALGSEQSGGPGIHQVFSIANGAGAFDGLAFANNSLYIGATVDDNGVTNNKIYKYDWNGSTFNTTASASTTASFAFPGPPVVYSSNGATANTALIWGITPAAYASSSAQAGTLRVFNASTLAELYNSDQHAGDTLGNFSKFAEPTVSGGKVYVPTFSNLVAVYGVPGLGPASSVSGGVQLINGAKLQ